MSKTNYIIEICRVNGCLTGKFKKTKISENMEKVVLENNFEPTVFLIDLVKFEVNKVEKLAKEQKENYIKIVITQTKTILGSKFDVTLDVTYQKLVEILGSLFVEDKKIEFTSLEKLKTLLDIPVRYSIEYQEQGKGIVEYFPFRCSPDWYDDDILPKIEENHRYIYTCKTLPEILFAIFHYLILNDYNKVMICSHCGRVFLKHKSIKQKYCKRKSTYPNYEHLTCDEAVRTILQKFNNRKNNIVSKYKDEGVDNYFYLINEKYNDNSDDEETFTEVNDYIDDESKKIIRCFKHEAQDYFKKASKNPTIKNLKACEKYIYEDNGIKKERVIINH